VCDKCQAGLLTNTTDNSNATTAFWRCQKIRGNIVDFRKQLTRPSSWMVYLSLLLMFVDQRFFASGSAGYWLTTVGLAALAGATMYVIQDGLRRDAQLCVQKNKATN